MSLNPLPFVERDSKTGRRPSRAPQHGSSVVDSPLLSNVHRPSTHDVEPYDLSVTSSTSSSRTETSREPDTTQATASDYIALDMHSPGKGADDQHDTSRRLGTSDTGFTGLISPVSSPGTESTRGYDNRSPRTSVRNKPSAAGASESRAEPLLSPEAVPDEAGKRAVSSSGTPLQTSGKVLNVEDENDGLYVPPSTVSEAPTSPLLSPDLAVPQEERLRGVDLYKSPSFSQAAESKSLPPRKPSLGPSVSVGSAIPEGSENEAKANESQEPENLAKEAMTFVTDNVTYNPKEGSVGRMVREMRPEMLFISLGLLSLAFASVCQLAIPKLMGDFIDKLKNQNVSSVNNLLILLVIIAAVNALFNFGWMAFLWIAGDRVVTRLRKQAFDCIVHREIGFFDTHRTGELISRLSSDVHSVNGALTTEIAELVQRTVLVTGGLAYMFYLSWDLTLISMALAPLLGLIGHRMAIYFHKLAWKANDQAAKANIVAEETVSCLRTVRSFAQERFMCDQYDHHCDQAFKLAKKQKIAKASQRTFVYFAGSLAVVLVLWYGAVKVKDGVMSAGALLTFVLYGMQVGEKSGQIMDNWGMLKTAAGSCQRVFQLIDEGLERKKEIALCTNIITAEDEERYLQQYPEYRLAPSVAKKSFQMAAGEVRRKLLQLPIHFENVSFAYPARGNKLVLNNLNLTLEPGKVIALVGTSGGGKSTIVALLERFYKPTSGRILWGDVDINTLDFQWFHRQVGYVGQEPVLFCTTIRENILYGVKNNRYSDRIYTEKDVERVARMANAHDFISAWPKGYRTVVGERGAQISGGQKQRIAIARAMLMDPPILLLDEATSALDNESERVVQAALDRLMVGRTTLMIAHRMSTVRNADVVVVVSGGQVVEKGTHNELMQLGGIYATLVQPHLEKQSSKKIGPEADDTSASASAQSDGSALIDENAINELPPPTLKQRSASSRGEGFVRLQDDNM